MIARNLSKFGTLPARFEKKQQIGPNVFSLEYQNSNGQGVAFWQVLRAEPSGFMIVLRTAYAANTPRLFEQRGAEAMGVARSLRCQVPNVPPAPDPPGLNKANPSSRGSDQEPDTLYNQCLDKEYYYNAETGENFWVSPSKDWLQNGPNGPGYYAPHGNGVVKLDPGWTAHAHKSWKRGDSGSASDCASFSRSLAAKRMLSS